MADLFFSKSKLILMKPYFALPIEGIKVKFIKYFGDAAKKTNGSVTLDLSFITFFEDW